jgi:hypothetical protein
MNVNELRAKYPKRFEREYYKWTNYAVGYDWWDDLYADFRTDCAALGVRVDDIQFSGFHSQGDGASFTGRMYVHQWMEGKGYHITHPAAYLACKDDGSYVSIEVSHRHNNMRTNLEGPLDIPSPSGIFAGLDEDAWDELIVEQLLDLSIEDEVLAFCEGLAAQLYKDLEVEYEHLTNEAAFIDSCELNDVTFEETEDAISA